MRFPPAFLLLALGCGGAADDARQGGAEAEGADPDALPDTATFVAFEAAGVPSWTPMRERGIGIVHFDPGPGLSGRAADTLRVRAERDASSPVIARLIADSMALYRFEAAPELLDAPGALEFGYEEVGLPVLDASDERESVVYLGTRAGEPVTGWATTVPGYTARTLWEELLPSLPLFFVVPPDSVRFHEAPDGPLGAFTLPPPPPGQDPAYPGDYVFWPLEQRGDWIRVRAVTPSDYCADPPAPLEDTLWIRWREPSGNPRVWFFTRGC
jgi:hypothetical protein